MKKMTMMEITEAAYKKYPVYTERNPNPVTKKGDCALEKRCKDLARDAYIKKLVKEFIDDQSAANRLGKIHGPGSAINAEKIRSENL